MATCRGLYRHSSSVKPVKTRQNREKSLVLSQAWSNSAIARVFDSYVFSEFLFISSFSFDI